MSRDAAARENHLITKTTLKNLVKFLILLKGNHLILQRNYFIIFVTRNFKSITNLKETTCKNKVKH